MTVVLFTSGPTYRPGDRQSGRQPWNARQTRIALRLPSLVPPTRGDTFDVVSDNSFVSWIQGSTPPSFRPSMKSTRPPLPVRWPRRFDRNQSEHGICVLAKSWLGAGRCSPRSPDPPAPPHLQRAVSLFESSPVAITNPAAPRPSGAKWKCSIHYRAEAAAKRHFLARSQAWVRQRSDLRPTRSRLCSRR